MEKPKTIFDYAGDVLKIFGLTTALFLLFVRLFGADAQDVSTLFSLGRSGISIAALAQLLLLCALIVVLRFVFFTEKIIRRAGIVLRVAAMAAGTVVLIVIFVTVFGWFPTDMPLAWICFAVSFLLCGSLGALISSCKERLENRKMAEALEKMKDADR